MGDLPARGHRHELQVVARARQRIDLAAIGVDDRVEARDEADHREQGQRLRRRAAVDHAEAVKQRLRRLREGSGAMHLFRIRRSDSRIEEYREERRDHQRGHAQDQRLRHVALWIGRFFRGERQLLDREEEPDGKGQGGKNAAPARR